MKPFDWISPERILFGAGRFKELPALASGYGRRIALLTGGRSFEASGKLERLLRGLKEYQIEWLHLRLDHEPAVESIDVLHAAARDFRPEAIIGIGGGSVLDAAKAVAALLANGGETLDYLEGVGRGKQLSMPALPVIAVPTTAGTGSEATKNAVIGDRARTFKKSMRSNGMMPAVALVDPELTYDTPLHVAAASGMDALTQLLEAYTSRKANSFSDAMALQGLEAAGALSRLPHMQNQVPIRESLALASLSGGICLANVGLGAVHGLASPLGAFHPVPHGAGCAALLPAVVRANIRAISREGIGPLLMQLQKYGVALELWTGEPMTGDFEADGYRLADWLADLNRKLELPGLAHYGIAPADFPKIIAGARGNSMQTNPVDLTDEDLAQILEASL